MTYCCVGGGCDRCVERQAYERHLLAEHRAALDTLGISAEQEQAMADVARSAMLARPGERWTDEVCEEMPPAGLTDVEVLADWYEVRGFRAMRVCANEEWAA